MSMTKEVARLRIARDLQELEDKLIAAQAAAASLAASCAHARCEVGAGLTLGFEPLLRLGRVQEALLKAGGETARVHSGLLEVAREVMMPDEHCPPPAGSLEIAQAA